MLNRQSLTKLTYFLLAASLVLAFSGCDPDKDKPLGEKVEDAADKVGDAAEDAADEVEDAVEDAGEELKEAGEEVRDEVEGGG